MDTPCRSSSVPAAKRRLVDIESPNKDRTLANMIIDFSTSDYPPYLKIVLDTLLDTREELKSIKELCSKIVDENKALRCENAKLKELLQLKESQLKSHVCSVCSSSPPNSQVVSSIDHERDIERKRSVVLAGIVESSSASPSERASHDLHVVQSVLDHLNVECLPVSVYRMGRPNANNSRLIKVVLPSSFFQQTAVGRASRLRSFSRKGVYLRPSLTKEERERQREERLAKRRPVHSNHSNSPPIPPSNTDLATNGGGTVSSQGNL
ncbi:unnamed protein product [Nippostrongylus brasiliensis]|uniref:Coiled-coil domain-containing protein n=1 Tax=Nippostrongylus brasiliensis TaxID=27835 RepID=A0A0N4YTX6_NIPBR|nr:unnamed protein product [Nippostrongylus brasiliensis]